MNTDLCVVRILTCPTACVMCKLRCMCHTCSMDYMLCAKSINIHSTYNRFQLCIQALQQPTTEQAVILWGKG